MGCAASRLEDEEAVKLCKDRKDFIKEAVKQRNRFASTHILYIQSLKRVSMALQIFVAGDNDHHELVLDSFFTPSKRFGPEVIGIPFKTLSPTPNQYDKRTFHVAKYLRSGPNPSVSVEERPQQAETVRIESYYPMENYSMEGAFMSQASPMNVASYYTPYDRPNYPPPLPSPQESQWDFFWNPFSSLDSYGYPYPRSNLDPVGMDDEMARFQRVREEEGIPELEEEEDEESQEHEEEEEEEEDEHLELNFMKDRQRFDVQRRRQMQADQGPSNANYEANVKQDVKEFQSKGVQCADVSEGCNNVELEIKAAKKEVVRNKVGNAEDTPGFKVFVNRRPASMIEAMKEIDGQFMRICDAAHEVSGMLEASRAQFSSSSSNVSGVKMLNPLSLLRSGSSRSSSSRFFLTSTSSRDDGFDESSSCYSEDSCMMSGSHQSTIDRLYAWEKKLYKEVKAGERFQIEYEKRLMQLRNQDENGEEPSSVDKTRAALRSLHTRLKVSIHTVESISTRINVLRDEELHPQLLELIQGLARMWRTMAECHKAQKRVIDDAKLLFLHNNNCPSTTAMTTSLTDTPSPPPPAAVALEAELRGWRAALEAWLAAQRAYARALAAWSGRCIGCATTMSPPPAFAVCMEWARAADAVSEARVMDAVDFFTAGVGSMCAGIAHGVGTVGGMEVVMTGRVMCAGIAAVVGALAEFAAVSAERHEEVVAMAIAKCGMPEPRKEAVVTPQA